MRKKLSVLIMFAVISAALCSSASAAPAVYFTKEITPEALTRIYDVLDWEPSGKVGVKISTGEPPSSNYLRPALIKDLVQKVGGTIVECNTAYGGSRSATAMHKQVARDHGFYDIAGVDILDEDGSEALTVRGGKNLKENFVGAHIKNYGSFIVLSHFKGHAMGGFGGAIKNTSIGFASSEGKLWIHSAGTRRDRWSTAEQDKFLESMAEAAKSVSDHLDNGARAVYISVMNRLSVDCDCDGRPNEPEIHDIGILASRDPVALDQACVDLIYANRDSGGASLIRRMEALHAVHTLEHAESIGLGSRAYELRNID